MGKRYGAALSQSMKHFERMKRVNLNSNNLGDKVSAGMMKHLGEFVR